LYVAVAAIVPSGLVTTKLMVVPTLTPSVGIPEGGGAGAVDGVGPGVGAMTIAVGTDVGTTVGTDVAANATLVGTGVGAGVVGRASCGDFAGMILAMVVEAGVVITSDASDRSSATTIASTISIFTAPAATVSVFEAGAGAIAVLAVVSADESAPVAPMDEPVGATSCAAGVEPTALSPHAINTTTTRAAPRTRIVANRSVCMLSVMSPVFGEIPSISRGGLYQQK
jgi:hypothetical protein